MAYKPMSAARPRADDPIFSAGPGYLPGEPRASQLHSQGNRGSGHTRPYNAQTQDANPVDLSTPRRQLTALQPKSVRHLTCWFWAKRRCKHSDDTCLYSHFDTGMLAGEPVHVEQDRPAVAGKNAKTSRPVYQDWRSTHQADSAVSSLQAQRQIEHVHANVAQSSIPTSVIAEQSYPARTIKQEGFSSAQYSGGLTHSGAVGQYGVGGHYESTDSMGGNGPSPHHYGGSSSKSLYIPGPSGPSGGHSAGSIEELQKQMKMKDKAITELAGIVESLEIDCGISIDDQTATIQKLMTVAKSMEKEAREAATAASSSKTTGMYPSSVPSTPSYGQPPANHDRIVSAMEGSMNLVRMEQMALARSRARKHAVRGDLASIKAAELLPRAWVER